MRKYEEERYLYDNIKTMIFPWISVDLVEKHALNGKNLSEKDTVVLQFDEELKVIFAIKRGEETFEILKDNMLPPEVDALQVFHQACENLARDVEYVVSNTMYGAFGLLADGFHEASAICLQTIWSVCADKLESDLLVALPSKDTVLFAKASDTEAIKHMNVHAKGAYDRGVDRLTADMYLYRWKEKEFVKYRGF